MTFPRLLCCLSAALALTACAGMNPFHRAKPAPVNDAAPNAPVVGSKNTSRGLAMAITETPDPVKLGEVRQIQVTITVRNNGKKAASFKFPTSQEIEIVLRDPSTGKTVSAWSADRTFDPQPRYVILNAKERLEFSEPITTRDLKPGKTYTLEAYIVGYDQDLRVSRPVIPQA